MKPRLVPLSLAACAFFVSGQATPGAIAAPAVRLTGAYEASNYDSHGNPVYVDTGTFTVTLAGARWGVTLLSNLDPYHNPSEVACDGTNIYGFTPGSAGTYSVRPGSAVQHFQGAGTIFPGLVHPMPLPAGGLWWLYCSGAVLTNGDTEVPDFLMTLGPAGGANLFHHQQPVADTAQLGLAEARLYLSAPRGDASPAIAELTAVETHQVGGVRYVSRAYIRRLRIGAEQTNERPPLLQECTYTCSQAEVVEVEDIRPKITSLARITDFRSGRGNVYLSTRWLSLQAAERAPTAKPALSAPGTAGRNRRPTVTYAIVVALSAFVVLFRATRRRSRQ